ncbi:2656_t:CDS:2, partial [Cetraspora pellucida]
MTKLLPIKKLQQKRAEVARSAYALIDLNSNEEYINSDDNSDESSDDNFMELDCLDEVDLIIEQLRAVKKTRCPAVYIGNSKHTRQRKNKTFREAAIGSLKITHFFSNTQLPAIDNDEGYGDFQDQDDQVVGLSAIEFVNQVMNDETLSKTEEAHYLAVLYFLRLRLQDIVNGGLWLARSIRNWVNTCMKKELIQPDLRGRLPSKSLLHDKLVSLQLASYLHSQKFNVDPIM